MVVGSTLMSGRGRSSCSHCRCPHVIVDFWAFLVSHNWQYGKVSEILEEVVAVFAAPLISQRTLLWAATGTRVLHVASIILSLSAGTALYGRRPSLFYLLPNNAVNLGRFCIHDSYITLHRKRPMATTFCLFIEPMQPFYGLLL